MSSESDLGSCTGVVLPVEVGDAIFLILGLGGGLISNCSKPVISEFRVVRGGILLDYKGSLFDELVNFRNELRRRLIRKTKSKISILFLVY